MGQHRALTKHTIASHIGHIAKAIIATVGGLAVLLSQIPDVTPFLPEQDRPYAGAILLVITAFATWYKANGPLVERELDPTPEPLTVSAAVPTTNPPTTPPSA